ncbi:Na+/H+ antiporter NhaA [Hymenobacter sp. BT730]|uniref:Na+/H+ antiporter NhaA n=1 Tax=Hymenobacter sp. BT730 TaxID=3063332 RepID=UPI0026E065D8|nr:Na+/H+ antiporter NhaA [Hymenobacter sp. BT730]
MKFFARGISLQALAEGGRLAGLLLIAATILSLVLSNTTAGPAYTGFWEQEVGPDFLEKSISHWINDGLMAIFFLLVGLEIKHELLEGELAVPRKAMLPALAAVGGAAVPALIHWFFTRGTPAVTGWAIPTATDIAFSLGILALLGSRVPAGLRVFLTALAIIDDLLAVIVIAVFYTDKLHLLYLAGAAGLVLGLYLLGRWRKDWLGAFAILGILLWYCMLKSGVHATVAGVLLAFVIPAHHIQRLYQKLHKPVTYGILPLFALCNTAIALQPGISLELVSPLGLGIMLGLVLGKPIGIGLSCWLLVRSGQAVLPTGVSWRQMLGLGFTAGIGFTMAIFIATLSFRHPELVDIAKLAVLCGSVLAASVGALILLRSPQPAIAGTELAPARQ